MEVVVRHIVSALGLLLGAWIITANYIGLIRGLRGTASSSATWWLGGFVAAGSLGIAPWLTNKAWAIVPVVIDFTCLPMFVIAPIYLLWRWWNRRAGK